MVGYQLGAALEGGREHFGYADGFAQPSIEGSGFEPLPGEGAPPGKDGNGARSSPASSCSATPTSRTRSPRRRRRTRSASTAPTSSTASSHQDVAGFRRALREAAATYPGGEELLAAKLVGRWRDGTPLDVSPDRPDPALVTRPDAQQRVRLPRRPGRPALPVGAHVRRMNPRHSLPFDGKLVNRHRIIRRGITYGDPLPEGAEDDGRRSAA